MIIMKMLINILKIVLFPIVWLYAPKNQESAFGRLFRGIVKFVSAFWFFFKSDRVVEKWLESFSPEYGELMSAAFIFIAIYTLIDGLHNFWTFDLGGTLSKYDAREYFTPGESCVDEKYGNIHRVMGYRDSKMSAMGNEKAAGLYASTQGPINVLAAGGERSKQTLGYLDSKLSAMGNEQALDYLRNLK